MLAGGLASTRSGPVSFVVGCKSRRSASDRWGAFFMAPSLKETRCAEMQTGKGVCKIILENGSTEYSVPHSARDLPHGYIRWSGVISRA